MESQHYFNPYTNQTFIGMILQLFLRFWSFISGDLSINQLASDEVQILVLIGVAASSALVGCFLVLRRMTMLANSLSHTILVGIVLAFFWTHYIQGEEATLNIHAMMIAALIMGLVTVFLTELLVKGGRLQQDVSTGLVFTSLFAIGVILLTLLTRNAHIGTDVVMGNVDALQWEDCQLVYSILAFNICLFFVFFKEFKITTFDSGLSRALGISPIFFNYLLMTQVSCTAIGAFRAVGVLMVLAFITGPALTARLLTHDLKKMLLVAVGIGCCASIVGVALSRHIFSEYGMTLSTGGVVVCAIVLFYIIGVVCTWKYQK